MADAPAPTAADFEEQLARIQRMNVETQKFVEEGLKLAAEARKLTREAMVIPFTAIFSGLTAGAAVFGAGIAFAKLFLP